MSSAGLTSPGQFVGTPDYSAPEQIQGRAVDGRTDQYALACVTYQLLTGALPFERDQGMPALLRTCRSRARRWYRWCRICLAPSTRSWPGDGQGPGETVRVVPGLRRRAAGSARPGTLRSPRAPPPHPLSRGPPPRHPGSPRWPLPGPRRLTGARRRIRGRAATGHLRCRPHDVASSIASAR